MMAGQRLVPAGYEFVRVLGSGAFGEVVLARHSRLKRLVAVKRIHAYVLTADESVRRFEREAKLLAATEAVEIVSVYDLIRVDDGIYLVMEYVPGRTLADLIDAGPLPADLAITVLRDVANALATAAGRGVVHRDIKPANIFVQPDGHAKLGDFGLARATADPSVFRTSTGTPMGTPAYFPPELGLQLSDPDERSDAYSFAVVAYEALTGSRPYEAPNAIALITAHWRLTPPDPASILSGFPAAAGEAIVRAMDHDPPQRLLPSELVDVLAGVKPELWPPVNDSAREILASEKPVAAMPDTPPTGLRSGSTYELGRQKRKSRRRWPLVAAGLAAAVVAVFVVWQLAGSPSSPPLRVAKVEVISTPTTGEGSCPHTAFVFEGTVHTNGEAGQVQLRWRRPDGELTAPRVVDVAEGQREVKARLEFGVSGSEPFDGTAQLQVRSPREAQADRAITYTCPSS
ncbi:MAG: hypothetical protein JWP10_956 [Nocardioidaceae bacterium]|nr:hypothetical protein [Nocardioidaceae bacterium]